jgi:hypothetical protein
LRCGWLVGWLPATRSVGVGADCQLVGVEGLRLQAVGTGVLCKLELREMGKAQKPKTRCSERFKFAGTTAVGCFQSRMGSFTGELV